MTGDIVNPTNLEESPESLVPKMGSRVQVILLTSEIAPIIVNPLARLKALLLRSSVA